LGKKKTVVSIARRLAEPVYPVLKNKTEYEARPWKGSGKNALAGQALMSV
jgi:hypothetical protein